MMHRVARLGLLTLMAGPASASGKANDFDGDGRSDVVWRHPTGALFLWMMEGTAYRGSYFPPIDLGWKQGRRSLA
jgi:hypothetical protein